MKEADLPKLAIRPYPTQYVSKWVAKNGQKVTFRPVRPEDEPIMARFHEGLSDHTVYLRYTYPMQLLDRISHQRLARICHIDYDRVIAIAVETENAETGEKDFLAVGRLSKMHGTDTARFSLLVTDCCQGMGIGQELIHRLITIAKQEHITHIEALLTPDNKTMLAISEKFGFIISPVPDSSLIKADLKIE